MEMCSELWNEILCQDLARYKFSIQLKSVELLSLGSVLDFLLKTNMKKFAYSYVNILLLQIVKVEQIPFLSAFYVKKNCRKSFVTFYSSIVK